MAWCPNCYTEYVDKVQTCKDCEVDLEGGIPPEDTEVKRYEFVETTYLTTATSEIEANMLKGLLDSNGISTVKSYREAGDYLMVYMGDTSFGIDLLVDKEQYYQAKELILPIKSEEELVTEEDTPKGNGKQNSLRKGFIILCIIIFIVMNAVYGINL
ncbi:DUF2007 domain-containing protein [Evansella sp. AB-rgal1]|uniref:putative signal transducing protein n=1 Tax=Evansella sp. AB-rgal1 TaxID=3242696 RepID=UPI00359CD51D